MNSEHASARTDPIPLHLSLPGYERLERIAWLMDRSIPVPFTRMHVGLDAILGLLPIGGDVACGVVQVGIVLVSIYAYKVPRVIAARMAANVLLDTTVGAIPFVGDVFDAFFKANTRNIHLLSQVEHERAQQKPVSTLGSFVFVTGLVLGMFAVLSLILIGFLTVSFWIYRRIS